MKLRDVANWSLFTLIFLIPFGTRQIWQYGIIGDVAVEWGAISLYGTQVLAVLFFGITAIAVGQKELKRALFHPMSAAIGILSLISVLSAALSPFGAYGGSLTAALWVVWGWFFVVAVIALRPPIRLIFWAILLAATIQSFLAVSQFLLQTTFSSKWLGMAAHHASSLGTYVVDTGAGRWIRAYGSFGHPNILGFFLVLGIISSVALVERGLGLKGRIFVWSALKFIGSALLFSLSKSAVIAGIASLVAYVATGYMTGRKSMVRAAGLVGIMVFAGFLAVSFIVVDVAVTRVMAVGRLETQSWNERISLTADAISLYQRHPLLGVGPGQMPIAAYREIPDSRSPWGYQPVHNVPLLVLSEIGLIGFLVWLALAGLVAVRVIGRIRFNKDDRNLPIILSLMAAGLTVSMFDHFLWSLWPGQLLFWVVMATCIL